MNHKTKICCNNIEYRQGFIDVTPGIHEKCINLESWNINPEVDITDLDLSDKSIKDIDVSGNTEIELSIENAEHLITQLQKAINIVKSNTNN